MPNVSRVRNGALGKQEVCSVWEAFPVWEDGEVGRWGGREVWEDGEALILFPPSPHLPISPHSLIPLIPLISPLPTPHSLFPSPHLCHNKEL
ncbi:MAG: hypothetical protein RMY29_017460 [Nostoc sp. CreGUA01]